MSHDRGLMHIFIEIEILMGREDEDQDREEHIRLTQNG